MLQSSLEKVLRSVLYAALFAVPFVPLLVWREMYFPYVTTKGFAFRFLVDVMLAAWLPLAIVDPRFRPPRSPVLIALGLFVAIVGLADVLGESPSRSLLSNYERMEGLVGLLHIAAFALVAASTLRSERQWGAFIGVSLVSAAMVAAYAWVQLSGVWAPNDKGPRIDGTFGNPGFLSVHMMLHMFLAGLLWSWSWRSKGFSWLAAGVYGGAISLYATVLAGSAARATFAGLAVGLGAIVVHVALSKGFLRPARQGAATLVLAGIVAVSGLYALRDTALLQSTMPMRRIADTLADRNVTTRLYGYQAALKGIAERPVLGWGQENFAAVYNKFYDPRGHSQDRWLDRAHNGVLDWLIAAGVLGLAGYLLIHAAVIAGVLGGGQFHPGERCVLLGLTTAYLVQNLFTFDSVASYLVWATVLALVAARAGPGSERTLDDEAGARARRWLVPSTIGATAMLVVGLSMLLPALRANIDLTGALRLRSITDLDFARFEAALAHKGFGAQEVRERLADAALFAKQSPRVADAVKSHGLALALAEMESQATERPGDARIELYLAELYLSADRREPAAAAFARTLAASPGRQFVLLKMANNEEWLGRHDRARDLYRQAWELDTSFTEGHIQYAGVLIRRGEMELADRLLEPLIAAGKANTPFIVNSLAARGDEARIARIKGGGGAEPIAGRSN